MNDTVIINADYNTSTDGGSIEACALTISGSSTVTVTSQMYISVQNSAVVESGSTLNIEHQGSFVQVEDDATTTNNGTINVAITTPRLTARDFMILGSPMTTTNQTVFNGAYQVLSHNTDNYTMYTDQAIEGVNFYDQGGDDLTNYTGILNPAEGYIVRPSITESNSYNYTFNQGTLNSGNISYTAGFNGNQNDSANLLANPYPSAIDASLLLGDMSNSPIVSELYFWEHLTTPTTLPGPYGTQNFSMEDISMYNLTGGMPAANDPNTTPNGIVATGQGFGIKAKAGGPITFTNAMRETTGNTTLRSFEDMNRLRLTVKQTEKNTGSSNLIGFTSAATASLDPGFDSEKLGTQVSLYTHLQDGTEQLGIQSREAFNTSIVIPMGFSTYFDEELTYTISILDIEGDLITDATVFLIDNLLGNATNLNENSYSFTTNGGVFDNRFSVVFEDNALSINEDALSNITMYPNPTKNIVTILSPTETIKSVHIIDVRGRQLRAINVDQFNSVQVDLSTFGKAMYFVKVTTENGAITKRIIKE